MNELLTPLLTLVLVYGYPIIAAIVLVSYLSIPIPLGAILLAAGSLTSDGTLNYYLLILVISGTAIFGDIVGYFIAKRFGLAVLQKTILKKESGNKKMESMHKVLDQYGTWSIFISRWLLTPLALPLDLIAGVTKFSFKKFTGAVIIGEFLWATIYVTLGYEFGANWTQLVDYLNNLPDLLALLTVGGVLIYLGVRMKRKADKKSIPID